MLINKQLIPNSKKKLIEPKNEGENKYYSWEQKKKEKEEYGRLSNEDRIRKFRMDNGDGNYAIVDKKQGKVRIYDSSTGKVLKEVSVGLGAEKSDAQTVTKVDSKGKANFDLGNKSTGAGIYHVSTTTAKSLGGAPSLNLMNEGQYNRYLEDGKVREVGTTFHYGGFDNNRNRVSNGCIRCKKPDLQSLYKNLEFGDQVYILPEEDGNEFVYENGKLNFRTNSKKDYDTYTDSKGNIQKGQGINRTTSTLNYKPIKITMRKDMPEATLPFAQSLVDNKQSLMKKLKIDGDVYNELSLLALGILGQETKYGSSTSYKFKKYGGDPLVLWTKIMKNGTPERLGGGKSSKAYSRGLTQIKTSSKNKEVRDLYKSEGLINKRDYDDPSLSAKATMITLAHMYNNELKGTKLLEDSNISWQDALMYLYQGKKNQVKNKTATPEKNKYIRSVKNNIKNFKLFEK